MTIIKGLKFLTKCNTSNIAKWINMKKTKNHVIKKIDKKLFLFIWMLVISNIYTNLYINLNPINTDLRQRGNFYSFPTAEKLINNKSSELIYGSVKKGSIMTSIKISKRFFHQNLS